MLIGICDDELLIREEIIRNCEKYKSSNISDFELICFSSGGRTFNMYTND